MPSAITRALAALLGCVACLGGTPGAVGPLPEGGHHVLFVGNSLTYTNDLPRTLADLAALGGDTVRTAMVALPNLALIDHANGGSDALAAIARGRWEYVVLQQGPTWPGVHLDTLILAARRLDAPIRAAGARPALYMVWPSARDLPHFDGVRESYLRAARAVEGDFFPAGEAWRAAWRADPALPLHGADGFHPSPLGTLLAALVMYERITGRDARALPPRAAVAGRALDVPAETVRLLQRAAHEANAAHTGR
jgi:hypothetical protein